MEKQTKNQKDKLKRKTCKKQQIWKKTKNRFGRFGKFVENKKINENRQKKQKFVKHQIENS